MVGIQRIIGIREPANTKRADDRGKKVEMHDAAARDGVRISPEAQWAAEVARLLETPESQVDLRAERIAQVKENLEQGTYRVQEVVLLAAARISGYVTPPLT